MNLQERMQGDIKTAMLAKDKEKLSIIRFVLGEFNREYSIKPVGLSDEKMEAMTRKIMDTSLEMGETVDAKILATYLPSMLTTEQLDDIITTMISENSFSGMKDMGKIMGKLKAEYGSTFDGTIASKIVREKLS